MEKLQLNATYKEAKNAAIQLGIHYVGKKTSDLIEMVNEKIEILQPKKVEKKKSKPSRTLEDYGLYEGQIVKIKGFEVKGKIILANREVKITRPSRAIGYIKGRLINPENGQLQKTEISITPDIIITESNLMVV